MYRIVSRTSRYRFIKQIPLQFASGTPGTATKRQFSTNFIANRLTISRVMSSTVTNDSHITALDESNRDLNCPESQWQNLCTRLSLNQSLAQDVWEIIVSRYSEDHRFYHTMEHIETLLRQASQHKVVITNKAAVDLAIFFHDIVYDPKSKTNEEDSAELFLRLLSPHLYSDLCEKVSAYIIATKKHDVSCSEDSDLKLFIDMDMSILGVSPTEYEAYARQIRSEYEFVPEADYCKGRAAVLESFVVSDAPNTTRDSSGSTAMPRSSGKLIFASELYREQFEEQARWNLAWECEILKSGRLV